MNLTKISKPYKTFLIIDGQSKNSFKISSNKLSTTTNDSSTDNPLSNSELIEISLRLAKNNKIDDCISMCEQYTYFDLNQKGINGWNLLHLACHDGHFELANYLINKRFCDPSIVADDLFTPLHLAIFKQNVEIINILLLGPDSPPKSSSSIDHITKNQISENFDNSYDIKINQMPDVFNGSALHFAASMNNHQIVFMLLMNKANTLLLNGKGQTALELTSDPNIKDLIMTYQNSKSDDSSDFVLNIESDDQNEVVQAPDFDNILDTLSSSDPFYIISRHFYKHKTFWSQSIDQIYESYTSDFIDY